MQGYLEITVKKQPGGLYRMVAETMDGDLTAMAEFNRGGWNLTGCLEAGPYGTLQTCRAVFTAYARAASVRGSAAGLRAIRALDRRVGLPAPVSPDPMQQMVPGYDGPPDLAEVRQQAYIDPAGALALINQHRQCLALYGEDPAWPADRRRLVEQGYGDLIGQTKHERSEITPYIKA